MLWLVIILLILFYLVQTLLLFVLEYERPEKTVFWILVSTCLPVIGLILYFVAGRPYKRMRHHIKDSVWDNIQQHIARRAEIVQSVKEMQNTKFVEHDRLYHLLSNIPNSAITGCSETQYFTEGEPLFTSLLHDIEQAKDHVHIQFYIFRDDIIGTLFQDLLIRKAKEGCQVRVICDGFGSTGLPKPFIKKMKDAGVEIHFFLPPRLALKLRKLNYRNHRKIVVIDGAIGYTGGMNIGDEYRGQSQKMGFWRDTHMRIIGDAVYFLQTTFLKDWEMISGQFPDQERISYLFPDHHCQMNEQVQIVESGPDETRHPIQELCFSAITQARERVFITTPYFIPDDALISALKTACYAGVDVRILIPYEADYAVVLQASLSYVEELLNAGVKFYRYRKGFIHAKVVVVDQMLAAVGSANLDMRSFYSNFELTAVMYSESAIERLVADFEEDLKHSSSVEIRDFMNRSKFSKSTEILCRLLSPLL
ncbi:cardiolipin synthase [Neobacillus mesonae]|nr:cardiolipin synthase [Neobacillus mesonae]